MHDIVEEGITSKNHNNKLIKFIQLSFSINVYFDFYVNISVEYAYISRACLNNFNLHLIVLEPV